MKKLAFILTLFFPLVGLAQNVAINNDSSDPDNTAILDIKSENKGLLIPRMTTLQRTSIMGPALGLIVYDTDTFSFWYYASDLYGGWVELLNGHQKHWNRTGANVFNNNSGNVGIGTSAPAEKLSINAVNPSVQFLNAGVAKVFLQNNGSDLRMGTYANNSTGGLVFATRALDRMKIDEDGQVGIGTSTPVSALTINSGSLTSIKLQNSGASIAKITALGSHLDLGTEIGNASGKIIFSLGGSQKMWILPSGDVGIGTNNPATRLTINDVNPILQLQNNSVDKGYIQIVNDDIKIGTNLTNDLGKFIVRTNGSDRFIVDAAGNATLGTNTSGGGLAFNGVSSGFTLKTGGVSQASFWANGNNAEILKTNPNGHLRIRANGDGIWMYSNGQISIGGGGKITNNYVVCVEGKLIASELTALASVSWPDYVFSDSYKLMGLPELKKYIAENKHLPNIPAATEIEKNGVQLGDMSKRLMEKVEELTLYILQLQEQIDALNKK
ncbi:MAG TPA: hypothetical protein VFX58_16290 [Chitinophagaceae bacterium]|nr:hypothetical protein [Chitinophagaceae bacterium]